MPTEQRASTSAKILYRPIGLIGSVAAGALSGVIVKQVWKRATPGDRADPPQPLESEYALREILVASAVQGAVFAVIKAVTARGGARLFQRWTGEWPGS